MRAYALLALLLMTPSTRAAPRDYAIDPVHTRVVFAIGHGGFSQAIGTFEGVTGTLKLDAGDWSTAAISIEVPLASLDLGGDEWNKVILGRGYLAAKAWPRAFFASTGVDRVDDRHLRVRGKLTVHGVTRPIAFDATVNAIKPHPLTSRPTAGFSARFELSRADFNVGSRSATIADRVEVRVELEARQALPAQAGASRPAQPAAGMREAPRSE